MFSCCSALWVVLWKRQCFMAIEGRSHMCISCCTNIVQCRAWNKGRADAGGRFHEQLMQAPSASYGSVYPTNTGLQMKKRRNASLLFKTAKEIWVKTQLRIEKKESKPFYGDFPLPPPLPCGDFWQRMNRQSILSLQLLSIFRDKRKSAGEEFELVLPCSESSVFCTQTLSL